MICLEGIDENMGSAITADINLLQAISRRCHLGKVVAAIKLKDHGTQYQQCQEDGDILKLLTNSPVELDILLRITNKTKLIKTISPHSKNIDTSDIETIFQQIITITKMIQVEYITHQK